MGKALYGQSDLWHSQPWCLRWILSRLPLPMTRLVGFGTVAGWSQPFLDVRAGSSHQQFPISAKHWFSLTSKHGNAFPRPSSLGSQEVWEREESMCSYKGQPANPSWIPIWCTLGIPHIFRVTGWWYPGVRTAWFPVQESRVKSVRWHSESQPGCFLFNAAFHSQKSLSSWSPWDIIWLRASWQCGHLWNLPLEVRGHRLWWDCHCLIVCLQAVQNSHFVLPITIFS